MLVLFSCVLLHEFGHSLACRSVGGQAEFIVLWPLGGIAFAQPPPRPWAWIWTTVAGPLVNVVLIPVFWLLQHYLLPRLPMDSLASDYLGFIIVYGLITNQVLLMFNLLPIYPMDGGRLLQEVLWLFIGYPRSLLVAGMIGTCGGVLFIVLGLGFAQLRIPLPLTHMSIPLGGDWQKGQTDSMLVIMGAFAAFYSFQSYRRGEQLVAAQKR